MSGEDMTSTRVKEKLIETAIRIFGVHGPRGLTFEDIASEAKVTRGSVYRLFGTTGALFDAAVKRVLDRYFDTGEFVLQILNHEKGEIADAVTGAVRKWYESLPRPAARLLMQAALSDPKFQGMEAPLHRIIHVIGLWLERNPKAKKSTKAEGTVTAKALIYALYQLKVTLPDTVKPKEEKEFLEEIIQVWVKAIS